MRFSFFTRPTPELARAARLCRTITTACGPPGASRLPPGARRLAVSLLALCLLSACGQPPSPVAPAKTALAPESARMLARWLPAEVTFDAAWSASTNHEALLASLDAAAIAWLAEFNTAGELRRKMETLGRKTNQHPFSERQIRAAMARKDAVKEQR